MITFILFTEQDRSAKMLVKVYYVVKNIFFRLQFEFRRTALDKENSRFSGNL